MLLLGHRGTRKYAPENTNAAFDLALDHGCAGFEFDVRATADGQCVICHDPDHRGLKIASTHFDALFAADAAMTTLGAVLHRYATTAYLDIELKVAGTEATTVELLREHAPQSGLLVSSFLPEVLHNIRALDPALPLGFITDRAAHLAGWRELDVAVLVAQYKLVTPSLVDELHAAQRKLFVWTVNDSSTMRRMADLGVDAVVSDDTKLLGDTLGSRC